MQENVIIDFSANMSGVHTAIDELLKLGKINAEQADAARKFADEYESQQAALNDVTHKNISDLEQFGKSFENMRGKIADGAISAAFKNVADAIGKVNPAGAAMFKSLKNVGDAMSFLVTSSKSLKQQLLQLSAEGKKDSQEYRNIAAALSEVDKKTAELSEESGRLSENQASVRSRLKELREEMMRMEDAGKANSDEFRELAGEAADLSDQLERTQRIVGYLSSDTKALDSAMSLGSGLAGAFNVATAAGALFGGEMEELQKAFYKVQAAMAVLNGVQAVANTLNKKSALIQGILTMQTKLKTAAINAETGATVKLTVVQRIFNKVAAMNPYVLLLTGLAALVAVVVAFTGKEDKATQAQIRNNEVAKLQIEHYKRLADAIAKESKAREDAMQHELDMMKARHAAELVGDSTQAKRNEMAAKEREQEKKNADYRLKTAEEAHRLALIDYGDLEKNKKELEKVTAELLYYNQVRADGNKIPTITNDFGEEIQIMSEAGEKVAEALQKKLENLTARVEYVEVSENALEEAKKAGEKLDEDHKKRVKEQAVSDLELAKKRAEAELGVRREARDAEIRLITDGKARQQATLDENLNRLKENLQKRREEMRKAETLTKAADEELKNIGLLAEAQYLADVAALNAEYLQKELDERRKAEDLELSLLPESFDKQKQLTSTAYDRQIADLQKRLETEKDLSVEQVKEINRQIIALEKKQAADLAVIKRQETMKSIDVQTQTELDGVDDRYRRESEALAELYAKGTIKDTEYFAKKKQLAQEYGNQTAQIEIDALQTKLNAVQAGSDEEADLLKQIADRRRQQAQDASNAEIQAFEDEAAEKLRKEKELQAALAELRNAAFDMANELSQMFFDNENARLEQQLSDLDKFYTTDAEAAKKNKNLKLISEQDLAKKQAEIKTKQAENQKKASIIEAIINAAKSITQVFATTGPPASFILAGITAAMTAIQIAKISSSPIPKYAKGRKGGRGEMALTGEAGPEVIWLPNGASVVPAGKSKKLMEAMKIAGEYKIPFPKLQDFDFGAVNQTRLEIDYDRFGRAVAGNLPRSDVRQLHVNLDEAGFTKYLVSQTGKTVSLNSRL